jgi:hypothetical protein
VTEARNLAGRPVTEQVTQGWPQESGDVEECLCPVRRCCRKATKGVCTMCTPWASDRFGSGRTSAGLGRIGYVFWSSQCLQGLECSSSPTLGTGVSAGQRRFSLKLVLLRVDSVHTLVSDLVFRGVWVPGGPYSVVWGSGLSPACRVLPERASSGSSSLLVLSH